MRTPEYTAELSLFRSERSYRGASAVVRSGAVLPQQGFVARPPIDLPPIGIDCDARRRTCQLGCGLFYGTCVRNGVPERTCARRYFVCSDRCDEQWESCHGLYRDPNLDRFSDRFAGVG